MNLVWVSRSNLECPTAVEHEKSLEIFLVPGRGVTNTFNRCVLSSTKRDHISWQPHTQQAGHRRACTRVDGASKYRKKRGKFGALTGA